MNEKQPGWAKDDGFPKWTAWISRPYLGEVTRRGTYCRCGGGVISSRQTAKTAKIRGYGDTRRDSELTRPRVTLFFGGGGENRQTDVVNGAYISKRSVSRLFLVTRFPKRSDRNPKLPSFG